MIVMTVIMIFSWLTLNIDDDGGDDIGDGGGQGDINSGAPSQADFILNYFL